jgi:hypothetical protein
MHWTSPITEDPMADQRNIDRREFLKRGAVAGTAAAGLGVWALEGADQPAFAGVGGKVKWGALCLPQKSDAQEEAVRNLQFKVGRKFDTTHYRMPWQTPLVNNFTRWSASSGHSQILSWFARDKGGLVSWRGIAQGDQDAWITKQARSLKAANWHGYFCFHKEPEDEGSPEDWKAAYHRVHQIFNNVGVRNFRWVVCLMASTYLAGEAGQWLPYEYGLLGVDGYNRYSCRHKSWRSFERIFSPAHTFAVRKKKHLYVIESGCVEAEPGRKATWIAGARAQLKRWPNIVGVSYNHESTDCTYYVTSSASALSAFRAMGHDRYFLQ